MRPITLMIAPLGGEVKTFLFDSMVNIHEILAVYGRSVGVCIGFLYYDLFVNSTPVRREDCNRLRFEDHDYIVFKPKEEIVVAAPN